MKLEIGDDPESMREARERLMEVGKKMGLSEAALRELEAKTSQAIADMVRDGAAKTSAKSIIKCLRESQEMLGSMSEAFIGLGKGASDRSSTYLVGMQAADIATAAFLIENVVGKMLEMMDRGIFDKKPEKKKEPEKPAEQAAATAE
jgi:hypothetical protein